MYKVFTRTWWKNSTSGNWPNGLEPHMGKKKTIAKNKTFAEAQDIARVWNANNDPGRYSRKAEIEET